MIDINKQYRTRDGREVIVHALNGPNPEMPLIASVKNKGVWQLYEWAEDGKSSFKQADERVGDLIEVVPKWRGKIWVHPDGTIRQGSYYSSTSEGHLNGWRLIEVEEVEL